MTSLLVFFVSMFILLALGIPIFATLGLSSLAVLLLKYGTFLPALLPQKMITGMDSFPLLAVPFFMLAGELMNRGGISKRLVKFASCLVGWISGGLGFVVILIGIILAAILGSSSASTTIIGLALLDVMKERGYDESFSAALIAASGSVGPIIPPSIPLIVYGVIAETSIAKLFVGGYIPGLLMAAGFAIYTFWYAKKEGYPAEKVPTVTDVWNSFKDAGLTLLLPLIIMGGILSGAATPTEAAVLAVVYAFILSVFVYREVKIKEVPRILTNAALTTAIVVTIVSTASLLSWVLAKEQIPQDVTEALLAISKSPAVFLVLVNLMLVVVGMFLDTVSALIILTPILLPAVKHLGIDPVLFGVLASVNLSIGVLTPPVGVNLWVISSIGKIDILRVSKAIIPFCIIIFLAILIMIFMPSTVTYLPNIILK